MDDAMEREPATKGRLLRLPGEKGEGRHRHYVDFALQMRLLIALVVMEITLISAGMVYLYFRFTDIIKQNLYRIHQVTSEETLRQLLLEVALTVVVLLIVNLAALLVADLLWRRSVRRVLDRFTDLARRTSEFDLRPEVDQQSVQVNHRAVELMIAWREVERRRALSIKGFMGPFSPDGDWDKPQERDFLYRQLRKVRRVLPPYSRRFVGWMDHPSS